MTSFSVDVTRDVAIQPFLLIVRTRHVVTIVNAWSDVHVSSAGCSEFPANSQIYRQQWSTVSRRSEPSSRTALMGEQPNPWDLLQPQDATSRHRTFLRRYRWRRIYLHPARPMSEGSAY